MATLIIMREKSMIGMLAPMDCFVNNQIICKVKNGEKISCEVENTIISFNCKLLQNPASETVYLDLTGGNTVNLKIKQGAIKPSINVIEKSVIAIQPNLISHDYNTTSSNPSVQNDLQTALRSLKKSTDISNNGTSIGTTEESQFTPTREVGNYFAIDENAQLWAIGKGPFPSIKNATPHSYKDIIDFELIEDGSSMIKGGVGRALVGGMLFGGIGAIVGSAAGKKKVKQTCTNLVVKITVNNIATPVEYIRLISSTTSKNSTIYRTAYQDAQEIISLLQVICNLRNTSMPMSHEQAQTASSAEEVRRYKALMDDGIITEEEFQSIKKKLLGI